MRQFFQKKIDFIKATLFLSLLVFSVIGISYAWQNPTANPPGGNVDAPVNVGDSAQHKQGAFSVGGIFRAFNHAYFGDDPDPKVEPVGANVYITGHVTSSAHKYETISTEWQSSPYSYSLLCPCDINTSTKDCDDYFFLKTNIGNQCYDYYQTSSPGLGISYVRSRYERKSSSMMGGTLQVYNEVLIGSHQNPDFYVPTLQFIKNFISGSTVSTIKYYLSLINEGLLLKNDANSPSFLFSQDNTLSINTTSVDSMLTVAGKPNKNFLSIFVTTSYPSLFMDELGRLIVGRADVYNQQVSEDVNFIGSNVVLSNYRIPSTSVGSSLVKVYSFLEQDARPSSATLTPKCGCALDDSIDETNSCINAQGDDKVSENINTICYDNYQETDNEGTYYYYKKYIVKEATVPGSGVTWKYGGPAELQFIDKAASSRNFSLFNRAGIFRIRGGTSTILSIDAEKKAVGINTTSLTSSIALFVAGNIKVTGQICDSSGRCLHNVGGGGGPSYWLLNDDNLYTSSTNYKVGIGTTSPNAMLSIWGVSDNNLFSVYASNSLLSLFVKNNGNVGIGTNDPKSKLSILGNVVILRPPTTNYSPGHTFSLESWGTNVNTEADNWILDNSATDSCHNDNNIEYICKPGEGGKTCTDVAKLGQSAGYYKRNVTCVAGTDVYSLRVDKGDLQFLNTQNEIKMILTQAGSLGIGITSSPSAKLYVNGDIFSNATITASIFCIGSECKSNWPTGTVTYWIATGTGVNQYIYNTNGGLRVGINTTSPNAMLAIVGTSTNALLDIRTSSSQPVLYINDKGSIGVNSTSPSAMLTVRGTSTNALLDIRTSSSQPVLYINDKGSIGVNSTSPSAMLTVRGTSTNALLDIRTSSSQPVLYITDKGLLGVNSTSPNAMLTIRGTSTDNLLSVYTSSSRPILNINERGQVLFGTTTGISTSTFMIIDGTGIPTSSYDIFAIYTKPSKGTFRVTRDGDIYMGASGSVYIEGKASSTPLLRLFTDNFEEVFRVDGQGFTKIKFFINNQKKFATIRGIYYVSAFGTDAIDISCESSDILLSVIPNSSNGKVLGAYIDSSDERKGKCRIEGSGLCQGVCLGLDLD